MDFLIVGGGVIGLSIALDLAKREPDARIVVLEKEARCGEHASGRNSGVLHAGFYYTADSLKARFTRDGAAQMAAWCEAHGVAVRRCGKLVVARSEADHAGLDTLLARAEAVGVRLESVTAAQARELEPRVRTVDRALWSPTTASVDPREVVDAMAREAVALRVDVRTGVAWRGHGDGVERTTDGDLEPGFVINAAGTYADQVARAHGCSKRYRILPFKGLYLYGDEEPGWLRRHVYPVPDLGMPFLGVHWTVTAAGEAKIGPTALPALSREHYGGVQGLRAGELLDIAGRELKLLLTDGAFGRLAVHELRKSRRPALVAAAAQLVDGVDPARWTRWGKPGIRAQLLDVEQGRLEMDFVWERTERSLHVLNAVSPAFTCALPLGRYLVDQVLGS